MSGPKTPPIESRPTTPRIHRHGANGMPARSKDPQQRYAHDMEWNVVGPMPTDEFLDEFFPNSPDLEINSKTLGIDYDNICFVSVPDTPAKEEDMYEGLVSVKLSICHLSNRTNFSAMISIR